MKLNTKIIVFTGLLIAISLILAEFPHFSVLPMFPFLKVDFADVPALFVATTLNPFISVIVEGIKNLIGFLSTSTGGIGELSNFLVGVSFALSTGLFSKYTFKNMVMKKKLLIVLPIAILIQTIIAILSNYYLIAPMYFGKNSEKILEFVIYGALPFNIIKGLVQSVAFYFLYRGVAPHINKKLFLFK